jgi:hypothetical protein
MRLEKILNLYGESDLAEKARHLIKNLPNEWIHDSS